MHLCWRVKWGTQTKKRKGRDTTTYEQHGTKFITGQFTVENMEEHIEIDQIGNGIYVLSGNNFCEHIGVYCVTYLFGIWHYLTDERLNVKVMLK